MLHRAATTTKNMKILNDIQKKFISENPRFTNDYLSDLFGVSSTTILRYRQSMAGIKRTRIGRNSSDKYYQMHDFAIQEGFKNVTEAFRKVGKREFEQQFEKQCA